MINLENLDEYTENRLIVKRIIKQTLVYSLKPEDIIMPSGTHSMTVKPFTTASGKPLLARFLFVLVDNDGKVLMMNNDLLALIKDTASVWIRISSDSYYTVTPISKTKDFTITYMPVNSNPG